MQANIKLDAQAKELAELQRQAAAENRHTSRRGTSASSSPRKPVGTRVSARLRGVHLEDEWQEIPDEWLKEGAEENDGVSASEQSEKDDDKDADMGPDPEPELADLEPEPDADTGVHLAKTGLESDDDDISELTELSEITPPATIVATRSKSRKASKKSGSSQKKFNLSERQAPTADAEDETELEWRPPDDFVEWETVRIFSGDIGPAVSLTAGVLDMCHFI